MAIEQISHDPQTPTFNYMYIILAIYSAETIITQYANYRQLKRLRDYTKLPERLEKLGVSYQEFKKSKIYSKEKMEFGIFEEIIKTIITLIILISYYIPYIWTLSGRIITYFDYTDCEYKRIPILLTIELIRETIIGVPFSYYSDFYIEQRHGYNKKTISIFIKDLIISLTLSIAFTNPIILMVVYLIEIGGDYFYIYVEIFCIFTTLLMTLIWPNFIAPLYNKFTELPEGELKDKIKVLSENLSFPLKKVYEVDGSKRSGHSNAYFFGFGSNKRIVLDDTIIKQMDTDEVMAVLCHELGHWNFGHSRLFYL